jgi:hypothetical protein
MRTLALVVFVIACGEDAKAPVPVGFSGTCKLAVPHDTSGYVRTLRTADELKTRVTLRVAKDVLVGLHVEIPDTRRPTPMGQAADNPLVVGDATPNVTVDRGGDTDVPIQLHVKDASAESQEPWDLSVRVRFRDDHAEAVAGQMVVTGACVVEKTALP